MKLETLTEAIGMIDDDLIANAKKPGTVQQKPTGSQAAAEPAAAPEASAEQVLSRSGAKRTFRRLRYAGWAAAAACLLLAAGVTLHLKRQKEDSSYTAASQSEQLVEVTVTSGTAQTTQPTETEHTTVTSPLTDASAADTAEDVTVTADAQTTATEAETPVTDPPANATAAPPAGTSQIPGTTKSTGTTSTASATQSSSERKDCQPYASYVLPEALSETIAHAIGTTEFGYYMDTPLPNTPWQKIEIPIVTPEETFVLLYRLTDTACDVLLYTDIERRSFTITSDYPLDTYLSEIKTLYGGDLRGGYIQEENQYVYYLTDLNNITQKDDMKEVELRKIKAKWAWQIAGELNKLSNIKAKFEPAYYYSWNGFICLEYTG